MYDVDGGVKTKVLAELMHHMISMHGKSASPVGHTSDAVLPNADGVAKHEPKGKIEGVAMVSAKPIHESDSQPVDMNEHGGEGPNPTEHNLGDLFGRKKQSSVEF